MRQNLPETDHANAKHRTRRIWYGHGNSRLITNEARNLAPATVIDEAIAGFERVEAVKDCRPVSEALAVELSAQLEAMDRQRAQLANLLRTIDRG